jgi:thiamine-phosphate pyrophosphorylase
MPEQLQRTLSITRYQDNRQRACPPVWFAMMDEVRLADAAPLIAHLPPASAVIVRHRDIEQAARITAELIDVTQGRDVQIIMSAARPPARLYADGVHIPEAALAHWKVCDIVRLSPAVVTASAHSLKTVMRAARLGVDAVLLSPVFATRSHPDTRPLGLQRFAAIAAAAPLPVIALGGVHWDQVRRVRRAGAFGIAGIGLFQSVRPKQ